MVSDVGITVYEHAPAWVIATLRPATVRVPDRDEADELEAT